VPAPSDAGSQSAAAQSGAGGPTGSQFPGAGRARLVAGAAGAVWAAL